MYLKQIEIVGFKSFADKSKVVLSPGITGIVGPNGSGKSNIADAIRWVLGEQSVRNLRGSKMEDVIFAGSEARKPTNLCEVSLILDNGDGHLPVVFDEVTVTRRVFRSGDSEYLINKQPCRLKDIHELFMDTGLGREAYSIIGQGKIEEMLSTRAEDRRGPFEDAAGIVKYKHRRKEAERRLDETNGNLVRVEDILAELEEQAGPLAKERERAEAYREVADRLEKAEITLLVVEIEALNDRFKQAATSVESRATERHVAQQTLASVEESWRAQRDALDQLSLQVETLQQGYVSMVEQRQKAQGDLALIDQQLEHNRVSEQSYNERRLQNVDELTDVRQQLEALRVIRQEAESALAVKSGELEVAADVAKEGRRESIAAQLDELNAEFIEANHQAATLRNELKMLSEQAESEAGKKSRFEQDATKWKLQLEEASKLCEDTSGQIESKLASMEACANDIRLFDEACETAIATEGQKVSQLHLVRADVRALSARLELLRDLEEGYDGYALGVRTVMQQANRGQLQGIYGSLATLIRVGKEVETAIETALGGAVQNIVVQSEADARAAIQMLKQRQAGRATFMPIDVIQSRRLRQNDVADVSRQAGFIGIASDLVDVDEPYRIVVEHLLGNVVVADTLEHANALAKTLKYRVRIVTYQGDVVSPGGVMSGGHTNRKGPGLLGRSRERKDVEVKLASLAAQEKELAKAQLELRSQVTETQALRAKAQRELEGHAEHRQALDAQLREAQYQKTSAEERLAAVEWEFHQMLSGDDVLSKRRQEAAQTLLETDARLQSISTDTAAKRDELIRFEQEQQQIQERLTRLRIEVATLRQERDSSKARLQELEGRETRLQEVIVTAEQEVNELKLRQDSLQRQSEEKVRLVSELVLSVTEGEEALRGIRQSRFEREAEVRLVEQTVTRHRQTVADAEDLLHKSQVASERADSDLAHALQKMGEVHGMTYEWAKSHYPLQNSVDALGREVQELRKTIQALGDVNLGAIEEHERLSERIEFLSQQRADLVSAQEKLDGLIADIDGEMSNRFLATFRHIQTEFAKAFQILFQGGEANLILTDPENPLTTGIEVTAKPPGKRLQNLNLLSGGERALTAMALLFAILSVRPVPFCVLDEVEAALDEANVARFSHQLRQFATDTQFIVITHRRGTMEEVDALYGVTMPERGVSSMVSVRLADELDFETA